MPTQPHPDQVRRFERATPNQLWQTDLFTFMLKRQNRRVYLVAFMDDHSRYIVSYGLHASQSAALVLEVFRAGIASCGAPAGGADRQRQPVRHLAGHQRLRQGTPAAGHPARGGLAPAAADAGQGRAVLGHAVAGVPPGGRVHRPGGRGRPASGTSSTITTSAVRIRGWSGLVPADRFFQLAPRGRARPWRRASAANALDLARNGLPKAPFYLTGQAGGRTFSVHAEGERVILSREGQARQEIDLTAPSAPPEAMPQPACSQGVVASDGIGEEEPPPPGVSMLDEGMHRIIESFSGQDGAAEGGQA